VFTPETGEIVMGAALRCRKTAAGTCDMIFCQQKACFRNKPLFTSAA
jgi:hypothetical protein